ncbi:trypsin zeta-like [Zeugodacus cucurbitae]|uniref:trypsin zeta-like n=1 Tax=Zeugodacus cucurbitae TaxID=28588 RepID=UPI0023D8E682|nr:trypsin zeta-like [Zeugodacus cucurbitae]
MNNCVNNILCVFLATFLVVRISAVITHPNNNQVIDSRIVGGKVVNIIQYPHQISLRTRDITEPQQSYAHSCGGSIYSQRIVITASHCIERSKRNELMVVVGTNLRSGIDGVIVPVQEILMHEEYGPERTTNDIALLVLAAELPINNITIKPIELTDMQPQPGEIATITGWGVNAEGDSPDFLHEVQVPIISHEICKQSYPNRITDDMLCAGLLGVGGKDACKKDSGGPLLINGKLAGVVSWGSGCGLPNFPGVYANVWYLLPWLRETIAKVEAAILRGDY